MYAPLAHAPFFFALLFGHCCAADPPAQEESVRVTVAAVFANGGGKVDEKLKCVAEAVRKTHPELTGFQVGQSTSLSIALGASEKFKLVDGQEASIAVKRCKECPERFCVEVTSKALVGEMTYTSVCGKYFPLVTGYKTKDKGDQLIILFKVESCPDKDKKEKKEKK
jgi:hypothetical protein